VSCCSLLAAASADSGLEFLVKWEGLGYDEATWEAPGLLETPEASEAIRRFESLQSIYISAKKRKIYQGKLLLPLPLASYNLTMRFLPPG
jgi:hypothetical protein